MNDGIDFQVKNWPQVNRAIVRHSNKPCFGTEIGELVGTDNCQELDPTLCVGTGKTVRHANHSAGKRSGIDGGSAQNVERLGVTQIAPARQNARRRNDFRWNAERGETIGEPLCETAYTAHFLPAGDQNLGRSFNLHLPLSIKSHGSMRRVVAGGPQVTERW